MRRRKQEKVEESSRPSSKTDAPPRKIRRGWLQSYVDFLERYPIAGNCLQAALISGFADVTKQIVFFSENEFDAVAVLRLMIFMCFFTTPMNMTIYNFYDMINVGALTKLALDQLLMCWITNPLQMSVMHVLTGQPIGALSDRVFSQELVTIVRASWMVWIPAKFILFAFVPPKFRILFQSFVSFSWQIYLSFQYNT